MSNGFWTFSLIINGTVDYFLWLSHSILIVYVYNFVSEFTISLFLIWNFLSVLRKFNFRMGLEFWTFPFIINGMVDYLQWLRHGILVVHVYNFCYTSVIFNSSLRIRKIDLWFKWVPLEDSKFVDIAHKESSWIRFAEGVRELISQDEIVDWARGKCAHTQRARK